MSSLTTDDDSYILSILERNPQDILDQLYQSSPTPTPTTDAVVNRTPSPISTAASRKRPRVVELRSENITVQKRCINMGKEEVREKEKGDEDKRRSEQEIGYKRKDEDITKKEITGRCQEERREEKSSVVRTIDDLKERPVRYFLMKCDSHYDLQNALDKQRWTSKVLHKKIADENCEVILIFSVRKSDYFQAYGRLISRTGSSSNLYLWDHHQRIPLSVFNIEWITITDLPYHETNHFHDPRNHNQPDSLFSDSQEIPENIGYQLCRLFDTKATEPQPTHPLERHSDSESPKMTTTKPLVREEEDEDVHNTDPDTEDFDFLTMTYEEYIEKTQRNSQKLKEEKIPITNQERRSCQFKFQRQNQHHPEDYNNNRTFKQHHTPRKPRSPNFKRTVRRSSVNIQCTTVNYAVQGKVKYNGVRNMRYYHMKKY